MNNWNPVSTQPEERLVEMKDEFGNTAFGYPTYYPFRIEEGEVTLCDPFWDGGFMERCEGLTWEIQGNITHWRYAD